MNLLRIIEFLRERLRLVVGVSIGVLVLVALADLLVDKSEAHTALERLPAFWSIFGFVGCVLIIILSKAFGMAGIMTREDYYDE